MMVEKVIELGDGHLTVITDREMIVTKRRYRFFTGWFYITTSILVVAGIVAWVGALGFFKEI